MAHAPQGLCSLGECKLLLLQVEEQRCHRMDTKKPPESTMAFRRRLLHIRSVLRLQDYLHAVHDVNAGGEAYRVQPLGKGQHTHLHA